MEQETTQTTTATQTIDYEAEYKKVLAERDSLKADNEKQKQLKDKYASENAEHKRREAEYKKKEEAQMSEEDRRAKEWQEMVDNNAKMSKQIAQMQLEKDLLANGFSTEESAKLIDDNFAVKTIADIIKQRVDLAVKSARAEFTKDSSTKPLVGKGTTQETSDFQAYQESKNTKNTIVEL